MDVAPSQAQSWLSSYLGPLGSILSDNFDLTSNRDQTKVKPGSQQQQEAGTTHHLLDLIDSKNLPRMKRASSLAAHEAKVR